MKNLGGDVLQLAKKYAGLMPSGDDVAASAHRNHKGKTEHFSCQRSCTHAKLKLAYIARNPSRSRFLQEVN